MRSRNYISDIATLKRYNDTKYKLTLHRVLRAKGYEDENHEIKGMKGSAGYDEKLEQSIARAKSKIFELAYCNDWDYFTTLTLDGKKFERYDLEKYNRAFSVFIRNLNKKYGLEIKYLTIPEQHKDGAWHLHGFIKGVPEWLLRAFTLKDKIPIPIRVKLMNKEKVFDWPAYREKFGWVNFEAIQNREAVSKYVTKYISKGLARCVTEINAHLYYCSKGLKRAVEIKRGALSESVPFAYENDYVKVAWIDNLDIANKLINDYTRYPKEK